MHLHKVTVRNFRLLADADLVLETPTTLIVGRNNSGKTSLSEAIRRFLADQNPKFRIEDFSSASYDRFCDALAARNAGRPDDEVRALIPSIELRLLFQYDPGQPELGPLSDFIIDLDTDCNEALVVARYELRDGAIEALFADQPSGDLTVHDRIVFFQELRERVPELFTDNIWAEDPNDDTNRKPMTMTALRALLRTGFINAQRGLDDDTSRDTDVLAKILTSLFSAAKSPTAGEQEQLIAQALQEAVHDIQSTIQGDFREKLRELMPNLRRIAFQRPEAEGGPCGRTFEDAFMLANPAMFGIEGATSDDQAQCAWDKLDTIKKSEFALKYAIEETAWTPPGYILDGLKWLALGGIPNTDSALGQAAVVVDAPGAAEAHDG
ncbi:MAG: AAA family ATPase [Paracoccaceae bacterium]|nr:AAA family ATPase [Paracoccaceae bacterium]